MKIVRKLTNIAYKTFIYIILLESLNKYLNEMSYIIQISMFENSVLNNCSKIQKYYERGLKKIELRTDTIIIYLYKINDRNINDKFSLFIIH